MNLPLFRCRFIRTARQGGGSRIRSKKIREMSSGRYRLENLLFQQLSCAWPFLRQISGRNFLLELCGEGHLETAPLQATCRALCSAEQSTFRGGAKGEEVPREGGEEVQRAKGQKKKTFENKSGAKKAEKHFPRRTVQTGNQSRANCSTPKPSS